MHKQKKIILPVLISLTVGLAMIVLAASNRESKTAVLPQQRTTDDPNNRSNYVHRSRLQSRLGWALSQLGDRLEKPGKERVTAIGLVRYAKSQTQQPVNLLNEFPDRLRLNLTTSGSERTLIFDRDRVQADSQLSPDEEALLETLVYDSSEHFFWGQAQQQATRLIGSRIRNDDGSAADYQGPFYDVYQVADVVKLGPTAETRSKFYYFNSDTLLLERVRYETTNQSGTTNVEVLLGDWRAVNNQRVPHRVERLENGASTFVFTLNSLNIGPRVNDSSFSNNPAN